MSDQANQFKTATSPCVIATGSHPVAQKIAEALGLGAIQGISAIHLAISANKAIEVHVSFYMTTDQAEAFASAFGEANLEAIVTYKEA